MVICISLYTLGTGAWYITVHRTRGGGRARKVFCWGLPLFMRMGGQDMIQVMSVTRTDEKRREHVIAVID